jgi:hypothetical protein
MAVWRSSTHTGRKRQTVCWSILYLSYHTKRLASRQDVVCLCLIAVLRGIILCGDCNIVHMIGTDVPFDVRMVFDIVYIWRRCLWCANAFMWWNEDGLSLHNFIPSLQFVLLDNFRFGSIAFHIFIQFIHSYTSIKRIWYSLSLLFSLSCPCIAFSFVCLSLCLTFVAVAAAAHMSKLSRFCLISSILKHVCY